MILIRLTFLVHHIVVSDFAAGFTWGLSCFLFCLFEFFLFSFLSFQSLIPGQTL